MPKLIPLLFFFVFSGSLFAQSVEQVEPPFWWAGMERDTLQLMLYGDKVGEMTVQSVDSGVDLLRVESGDSPNYLFVYLNVGKAKPGAFKLNLKSSAGRVETLNYELRQREPGAAQVKGFDQSDVIYLITPDRFVNGDPDNDNVGEMPDTLNRSFRGGRHGGDLAGIERSLDYLADMGFTAIWLNPVLENDMEIYSYHGYSTTDFYRVDPRYGTNEQYRELVQNAQRKGIKVIMDVIVNHFGSFHPWMADLPTDDWINFQQEGFTPTTHRRETIQDPYASEYDKRAFSDGWFVKTMPDLNQRNPLVADYLTQVSLWWIEYLGLNGLRMDTYPYPDKDYMAEWVDDLLREYPDFGIVGEEWSTNPAIVAHWQRGKQNANGYRSNLPSVMDFPLQHALIQALKAPTEKFNEDFADLYRMLANDFQYADPSNLVVFADNHDMSRALTQLDHNPKLLKMALAYLATTRGIPQIFYGTEVLMSNPGTDDHGIIRSDFYGGWEGDEKSAFTGEGLTAEEKEMQQFVKTLLNWRKDAKVVHSGQLMHYAPLFNERVYTLFRYDDDRAVMLILNQSSELQSADLSKYRFEMLDGVRSATDALSGERVSLSDDQLELPPQSFRILEFNRR